MKPMIEHYYNEEADCIVLKVINEFPLDDHEIDNFYKLISELTHQYKTTKILIDYREMIFTQTVHHILKAPVRAKKFEIDSISYNVAYIFDIHSASYKRYKLFLAEIDTKKFFGKIKMNYKIFENYDEALSWLKNVK